MEKFTLFQTALYAKGWYKRYQKKRTIWDDLKIILTMDGYSGEYMDKTDIVSVVLNQCQRLNTPAFKDLTMFANGISRAYCWKHGYFTKDWMFQKRGEELPEYDYYEAIIRYCLSNLVMAETKELCGEGNKLPGPDYTKGLKRSDGISNKKLKEMF